MHKKIFEIFHRIDQDSSVEGEGLGLAIVDKIISRHRGKVWVESEHDKGSKFFVSLSIKQITEALGISISKITIGILGHGFIGSRLVNSLRYFSTNRIFVVDPRIKQERNDYDKVILSRDPAKLASCDLVVILTASGEQAEGAIEYLKPGVIIVDDTHPQLLHRLSILIEKNGGRVVKAVLGLDGVAFWPRLPQWGANWLPGCCIEGLLY
jgi:hypothetical protein